MRFSFTVGECCEFILVMHYVKDSMVIYFMGWVFTVITERTTSLAIGVIGLA